MVRDLDDLMLMACIGELLYSKVERLDIQDLEAFAGNIMTIEIEEVSHRSGVSGDRSD